MVIVLFSTLSNADNWVEIAVFAEVYQDYLHNYIKLENGPSSHDTICKGMGLIEKRWVEPTKKEKRTPISYPHGTKEVDIDWAKKQ